MTRQEMFNLGYLGVLAQGAPAASGQNCQYFVPETGDRCAVGYVLPLDDAMKMAGIVCGASGLRKHIDVPWDREDDQFMNRFQGETHDRAEAASTTQGKDFIEMFKIFSATFAEMNNLEIPTS